MSYNKFNQKQYHRPAYARNSRKTTRQNEPWLTLLFIGVASLVLLFINVTESSAEFRRSALVLTLTFVTGALVIAAVLMHKNYKARQGLHALNIADVDRMDPMHFEAYIGMLFRQLGYKSQVIGQAGDYGIDVLIEKNGVRTGVQVKHTRIPFKKFIGLSAVQEVVAGIRHHSCAKAVVITNAQFSEAAKTLAAANDCQLMDRSQLGQLIHEVQQLRSK